MARPNPEDPFGIGVIIATSVVTFISGMLFGVYAIRGHLLPPAVVEERRKIFADPVESDESDVDEAAGPLDHAPNWANRREADRRDGLRATRGPDGASPATNVSPAVPEECKLVLVVRTDLAMGKGKIAAQCGHATLACYKALVRYSEANPSSSAASILRAWEHGGQPKIAVQVRSEAELLELKARAHQLRIPAEVIADAGRTQIEAGSLTVLGIGPAPKSLVNQVTGHLKLL